MQNILQADDQFPGNRGLKLERPASETYSQSVQFTTLNTPAQQSIRTYIAEVEKD